MINNIVGAMKMKQVTLQEFMQLPEGTLYQTVDRYGDTSTLLQLGEVVPEALVWEKPLINDSFCSTVVKEDGSYTRGDFHTSLEKLSFEEATYSKDCKVESDDDLFIVWELMDIVRLRDTLTECIIKYPEDANK